MVLRSKIEEKMSWEKRLVVSGVLDRNAYILLQRDGVRNSNAGKGTNFQLSGDSFSFLWEKGILGQKVEAKEDNKNAATQPVIEEVVLSPLSATYKLVGTIIGDRDKIAFIMNKGTGEVKILRLNEEIEPGAKISAIKQDKVEILRGKRQEIIFLFEQDEQKFSQASLSLVQGTPESVIGAVIQNRPFGDSGGGGFVMGGEVRADLKQVGPDTYEVRREYVQANLSNMAGLLTSARAIPYIKNGQIQGFRLINITPGSFFSTIGIRNGDVIKRINGIPASDPESIFKILQDVQNETYFEMEIERGNETKVFKYYVR
jgi:general secretion pathway protein C